MTDSKTGLGKSLGWVCGISLCVQSVISLTIHTHWRWYVKWTELPIEKASGTKPRSIVAQCIKPYPQVDTGLDSWLKNWGWGRHRSPLKKELSVTDELSTRGGKTASHSLQTECILWHPDTVSWTATNTDSRRAEMTCHGKPGKRFLWSKSVGTNSDRPWNTPFQPCHKATFLLLKSPCPHH